MGGQSVRREVELPAIQLNRATVFRGDRVAEPSVVITIGGGRRGAVAELPAYFALDPLESLLARIREHRAPIGSRLVNDQVAEIQSEQADIPFQSVARSRALQTELITPGRLRLQNVGRYIGTKVDGRGLIRISVVGKHDAFVAHRF